MQVLLPVHKPRLLSATGVLFFTYVRFYQVIKILRSVF